MSKNILVKQTGPTVFQSVGPTGTRPSFMDMARTTFAPRDGRVTGGQRAMGALGMLGKVGAAAATAQQTAERMQAGDASAPLQAGITYQGLDPTGTINPNIGEQIKPSETQALPTPPTPPPLFSQTGVQPNTTGQRPGSIGVMPSSNSFSSPIDMLQYPSVANQFDPNQYIDETQQLHQNAVTPQGLAEEQKMGGVLAGQGNNQQTPQGLAEEQKMGGVLAGQQIRNAFVGTLFDKLGPDMVYKMTPHEIGAVSALMYLKLS